MGTAGARPPMSIFDHYVADLAIAHQKAIRAMRDQGQREASEKTVVLFHRMHRLQELVDELGAEAVFRHPARQLGLEEVRRLFPPEG